MLRLSNNDLKIDPEINACQITSNDRILAKVSQSVIELERERNKKIQNRIPLGFHKGSAFSIMGMPETSQFESKGELIK